MTYENVKSLLSRTIPGALVDELLGHHRGLKLAFFTGDWEKCLLKGGKIAELTMRIIRFFRNGYQAQGISVESEIKQAEGAAGLPDELRLLIPRHVRVLYDHRNKRGGGHASFDPNEMDSRVVVSVVDWVLAELLRLHASMDPGEASRVVRGLVVRQVPYVEEIDGDLVALAAGASAREDIGLLLYKRYPERTSVSQLGRWLPSRSASSIRVAVTRMKQHRDVHTNQEGAVLTAKGLVAVEGRLRGLAQAES